jgi:hypothetical protein
MLKGSVRLVREETTDPNKSVTEAIVEAARRTDASNKALIDAVKGILAAAPQVQVAAPQVKVQLPANQRPTKWVFKVERDENGLMTSITAEAK